MVKLICVVALAVMVMGCVSKKKGTVVLDTDESIFIIFGGGNGENLDLNSSKIFHFFHPETKQEITKDEYEEYLNSVKEGELWLKGE